MDVREILCKALDDLLEDQFKRFKLGLRVTECNGKPKIPAGFLEKADKLDTVDLMCGFYGEDDAVTVCIHVLEEIPVRDVAVKLKKATQRGVAPHPIPTISDYRNHIKTKFQIMKDPNSLPGEYVHLSQRYSTLIIIDYNRPKKQREHEIMASGRRHAEIMKERDSSSITIEELFKPDKYGLIPQVVVLQGAAGIGKTTTARKIMFDWACGQLYKEIFDYVFYISCREMNIFKEKRSVVELILKQWPNQYAVNNVVKELIKEILRNPQKLLFIIDGFDELRFSFDQPEDSLCTDPWQKEPVGVLLSSLFHKQILPESYLIITTRPTALEKLRQCLECSRYVEILGFSVEEREEYFHNFFENKKQATQAFQIVKQNRTLFTLCLIPLVCWIICTVMKQQMESGEDLEQRSNTLTAVYVQYLYSLLRFHHGKPKQDMRRSLKSLCLLAADGIWKRKILFGEEEMKEHNLVQEDSFPLFLNENIFKRDLECVCTYSFIHLSFQEFFAALYYALEEGEVQQSSQTPNPDLRTLLKVYKTSRLDLEVAVRFLFGLLNESKTMKRLKATLGLKISPKLKEILLDWAKSLINEESIQMQIFQNLYESQDESFVKCALDIARLCIFQTYRKKEEIAVAYCLEHCHSLKSLCCDGLSNLYGTDAYWDELLPVYKMHELELPCSRVVGKQVYVGRKHSYYEEKKPNGQKPHGDYMADLWKALKYLRSNLEKLEVFQCDLTVGFCEALISILCSKQSVKEFSLLDCNLEDSAFQLLCKELKQPNCRLGRLSLMGCFLTAACCESLAKVLSENHRLKQLHMPRSAVENSGIKLLCEGLKHPGCKLQDLWMDFCYLTGECCGDLACVLSSNQNLKELRLSSNPVYDKGMKFLCTGLKHANCKLEKLSVSDCCLTAACCEDLAQVLRESGSLKELNLSQNEIKDKGVKLLCEGLKHPDCKLEKLSLGFCQLTSAVWEDLCTALITNQYLIRVDICDVALEEPDKKRFCDALKCQGKKERRLWVNGKEISTQDDWRDEDS